MDYGSSYAVPLGLLNTQIGDPKPICDVSAKIDRKRGSTFTG
jgi:hypothetical protein